MRSADEFYQRSIELYEQQHYAEAACCACQGIQHYPDDGRLWQLLGTARWLLHDFHGACTALEHASCLLPLFPIARCALASAYYQIGKPELARGIYAFLAEDDCCPPALLEMVAAGLGKLEEFELGLRVCRKLIVREPGNHRVLLGMAYYMSQLGLPEEMIVEPLKKAHALAPEVLLYKLNLAALYHKMGRTDSAYPLVAEVSPAALLCPYWLRKMMKIVKAAGDRELYRAYAKRVRELQR